MYFSFSFLSGLELIGTRVLEKGKDLKGIENQFF